MSGQMPLVRSVIAKAFVGFKTGTFGTTIPHSTNPVGTYTTKLRFWSTVRDDLGTIVSLANSRLIVPVGYKECRISYNLAWGLPYWAAETTYAVGDSVVPTTYTVGSGYQYVVQSITDGISDVSEPAWPVVVGNTVVDGGVTWVCRASGFATGWRGCRIKNGAGNNFGNTRIGAAGDATTTNNGNVTPWMQIVSAGAVAPDTIAAGDYFEFYPSQTSGQPMTCGADSASSFVQLELR